MSRVSRPSQLMLKASDDQHGIDYVVPLKLQTVNLRFDINIHTSIAILAQAFWALVLVYAVPLIESIPNSMRRTSGSTVPEKKQGHRWTWSNRKSQSETWWKGYESWHSQSADTCQEPWQDGVTLAWESHGWAAAETDADADRVVHHFAPAQDADHKTICNQHRRQYTRESWQTVVAISRDCGSIL